MTSRIDHIHSLVFPDILLLFLVVILVKLIDTLLRFVLHLLSL